jgi:hypothetical protein
MGRDFWGDWYVNKLVLRLGVLVISSSSRILDPLLLEAPDAILEVLGLFGMDAEPVLWGVTLVEVDDLVGVAVLLLGSMIRLDCIFPVLLGRLFDLLIPSLLFEVVDVDKLAVAIGTLSPKSSAFKTVEKVRLASSSFLISISLSAFMAFRRSGVIS